MSQVDPTHERPRTLRIGTRGSELARWQSTWVARRLEAHHPHLTIELVEIRTEGDRDRNTPLAAIGGVGLFTKEIQRALLDGRVDLAVHSLKDLPSRTPPGLVVAAVPVREDVADALIAPEGRSLDQLPPGARVGTGSPRRRAQILHVRPDLEIVGIRGNVETRLALATRGELAAVILAEAGLRRLGLDHHVTERLAPPRFLPAVGQGALGLECRSDDETTLARVAPLDDRSTHRGVIAERRVLAELEGGCLIPLAAYGREEGNELVLDASLFDPDGREAIHASDRSSSDDADALGLRVAGMLRDQGAERLLKQHH